MQNKTIIGGDKIVVFTDGTIGLVEKITEEYNPVIDGFCIYYTLRFADGHQVKFSSRELAKGTDGGTVYGLLLLASDILNRFTQAKS